MNLNKNSSNDSLKLSASDVSDLTTVLQSPLISNSPLELPSMRGSSIAFVDSSVENYQQLVAGVAPGIEVHVLQSGSDAISQITQTLLPRHGIESLHIISHGQAGSLDFGSGSLNAYNIVDYAQQFQLWGNALTENADILLYGCNVAEDALGKAFVDLIGQFSGADIAASDDLTASVVLGGNWELEYKVGTIESCEAFSPQKLAGYKYTLSVEVISRANPNDIRTPPMSADGRYVVFTSVADNVAVNDENGFSDVFLLDRLTNSTTLVSRTTSGISGNDDSHRPVISSDGRYVVFSSYASNLVANNTNDAENIFLFDRENPDSGVTLVSRTISGIGGNSYSFSDNPVISSDGRYVVFTSNASNLVTNDTNGTEDIFLFDRENPGSGVTLVSRTTDGSSGNNRSSAPVISSDGRYVVFTSNASNLVTNDTNGTEDIFLFDRENSGSGVKLVSRTNQYSSEPVISSDGRYIAFISNASNLVANDTNGKADIFLFDRENPDSGVTLVSRTTNSSSGNNYSNRPVISSDGRYIAFISNANNLVANDTNGTEDIFLFDRENPGSGVTLVSRTTGGSSGNSYSYSPVISSDGRYIVFTSFASNLVANDTNNSSDIFLFDRENAGSGVTLVSRATSGSSGNGFSNNPVISSNGRYVVFNSNASNLVANDTNTSTDVFGFVVNSPPTITTISKSGLEDSIISFSLSDFSGKFTDVNGDNLSKIKITSLPTNGILRLGGANVSLNQEIDVADISKLTFTPALNYKGTTTFRWNGYDGFSYSAKNATVSLTINPNISNLWEVVATGDFDNNGKQDILQRNFTTGGVRLANPGGNPVVLQQNMGINWSVISTADFTGDNKADILWRNMSTGENRVWEMNGTSIASNNATFRGANIRTVTDLNWQVASTVDFDGDKKADILWRHVSTGETIVWKMNGANIVSFGSTYRDTNTRTIASNDWQIVSTADFNGDKKADILWRHASTGETVVWQMDGAKISSWGTTYRGTNTRTVASNSWQVVSTADFNKDGKADILWRHVSTGETIVWQMDGAKVVNFSSTKSNNQRLIQGTSWQVISTTDFNNDGNADILWRNTSTGEVRLWQMDLANLANIVVNSAIAKAPTSEWQLFQAANFYGESKVDSLWVNFSSNQGKIVQIDTSNFADEITV